MTKDGCHWEKVECGVTAHPASLSKFLIKQGFSVKNSLLAAEAGRDDVVVERRV